MSFIPRHIGPTLFEQQQMLEELGYSHLDSFIEDVIPGHLISNSGTTGEPGFSEYAALQKLKKISHKNRIFKNYIGMGYAETITPNVIKRNVLENPGWYTAYTPYQAEISQGRLEALLNYQQMVMDLTGFNLANASLLDEATAAAEAMLMSRRINHNNGNKYFITAGILPQNLDVIKTRAHYAGIEIVVGTLEQFDPAEFYGIFIQNPDIYGTIQDFSERIVKYKQLNANLVVTMGCDILSLVLFKSPSHQGVDIAIGTTQRFGVPLGFGGPAAAYIATDEKHKRMLMGRIIGVSTDSRGNKALRMSLQTREQHIRREKATSNICTAQVLLANMAGFYAVYHGSLGLSAIATKIHHLTLLLKKYLELAGFSLVHNGLVFDTLVIKAPEAALIYTRLLDAGYLVGRKHDILFIALGEKTEVADIEQIFSCFTQQMLQHGELNAIAITDDLIKYQPLYRIDKILTHKVFNSYHSETNMMRYLKYLENKDISLVHSMIPLGSCTMKLNAASELEPISWDEFANIHPFTPPEFVSGYLEMIAGLKNQLKAITGFDDVSMQPNSGAQGEYAGLLAIRRYLESTNQTQRNICLIPKSAHGTNPATAHMMGMEVVVVNCDSLGNVDVADLTAKAQQYTNDLACLMITYPSTHGVFEPAIKQICQIIHDHGAQVYMDGANLNALVGLVKPAQLGADVAHINLHKTFSIPHGGGGPGMGPIGVKAHLAPFLPGHHYLTQDNKAECYAVSSAPYGSSSILPISWMYITLLGEYGIQLATKIAILNANYIAHKLGGIFPVLYTGINNKVAHECILDLRPLKAACGITEVDIAKRLMDYGFHAPTMSFPVPGTLMVEPTESESLAELERFILAMQSIHAEVMAVNEGKVDKINNPLKNAPHTLADIINWDKPYSIEIGCFPLDYLKHNKIFPNVNRIDDAHGDRNFLCNCFDFS
ncbi:MAG: aminomethyl-transferring glycine dehydrogenase [Burkholderiales bacterium]|nr:aminomethyl-transferring glycine dehydrogenase [Burkholderiales bacterium]